MQPSVKPIALGQSKSMTGQAAMVLNFAKGQSINQQRQENMVQKLADAEKSGSTSDKVAAKAKVAKVVTGTGLKSVQVGGLRAVGSLAQYVADVGDTNRSSKRQAVANYVKGAGDEAKTRHRLSRH